MIASRLLLAFAILLLVGEGGVARAELTLARLFTDHAVLQRGMSVPVWGWADPGEAVTAVLDEQQQTATADAAGKWLLRFDALQPGPPRRLVVRGQSETVAVQDLLVGEVWVCGGQSNMEWPLSTALNAKEEIAAADDPELRLFQVGNGTTPAGPVDRLQASAMHPCEWQTCTPKTAAKFSAAAYFFGRELRQKLGVPVGLIFNAVGATPIEAWISREALLADDDAKFLVERSDRYVKYAETPGRKALDAVLAAYDERQKAARAAGGWFWRSDAYQEPRKQLKYPGTFFNGRVNPLLPYAVRGVIWYQGEANWAHGYAYRRLFPLLICDWRSRWGQGDFPFLFVQLANFGPPAEQPAEAGWADLRESQAAALPLPNTAMAVAIDIGDVKDIHPKNKQDVGRRLALAARGTVYGENVVYSGPTYREMQIDGAAIRLRFDHVGGGLVAKDGALKQFAIAGVDKKFVWAEARIDGNVVVVRSDAVAQPVAVRYAWHANPAGCNLYNAAGLPAAPFRTEDWPTTTTAKTYRAELDLPFEFKVPRE